MTEERQVRNEGSETVAALEAAWAEISRRHPDVQQDVVFIIGTGAKKGGLTLGSVTVNRSWQEHRPQTSRAKSERDAFRQVFIAAETLAQHPGKLLETMLHEAAHTVAMTRGIKDTSRQNRYHNGRFRTICEELGLEWAHEEQARDENGHPLSDENGEPVMVEAKGDTVRGYSDMSITKATLKSYRETIVALDKGIVVERGYEPIKRKAPVKRRTVCLVANGDLHGATPVSDVDEATEELGESFDEEHIQRLGVVVYEGLARRGLLAGHVWWTENV